MKRLSKTRLKLKTSPAREKVEFRRQKSNQKDGILSFFSFVQSCSPSSLPSFFFTFTFIKRKLLKIGGKRIGFQGLVSTRGRLSNPIKSSSFGIGRNGTRKREKIIIPFLNRFLLPEVKDPIEYDVTQCANRLPSRYSKILLTASKILNQGLAIKTSLKNAFKYWKNRF